MRKLTSSAGFIAALIVLSIPASAQTVQRPAPGVERMTVPNAMSADVGCPGAPGPKASSYCAKTIQCRNPRGTGTVEACAEWKMIR